jgi:hypothetical protein
MEAASSLFGGFLSGASDLTQRVHSAAWERAHDEAFIGAMKPDSRFWEGVLKNGHVNIRESVRVAKKTFDILEHFTPVLNRDSIPVKYINFVTDDRIGNS